MDEVGAVVLPIAIAIVGSVTSIWIAVAGNRSRRQEIEVARADRQAERDQERRDRDNERRVEAVESIIREIVRFADLVDVLKKSLAGKSPEEIKDTSRPHDFELHEAIARISTRGGDREVSMAAGAVLHAAKLRDVRNVPEALGPLQTALEQWLLEEVPREEVLATLEALRDEQYRRAEWEEKAKTY